MTTVRKDTFSDLECHRLRLEESVSKLRKSLQHWQTWEAEYEGLKEEILAFGDSGIDADLIAVGEDFGGTLVTRKEIKDLFVDKKGLTRRSKQVVELLSKRIDYVQQNVITLQKQLTTAEEKLSALLVLQQPEVRNEEGLPVTEIREELDEDGNVIASTSSNPGEAGSEVVEALRKAGVKELNELGKKGDKGEVTHEVNDTDSQVVTSGLLQDEAIPTVIVDHSRKDQSRLSSQEPAIATPTTKTRSKGPRKSVTFAEDTKEEPLVSSNRSILGLPEAPSRIAQPKTSINGRDKIFADSESSSNAILPDTESPEDAKLRQEMLQYGLSEVGAVVAELALEESESETSYSDVEFGEEDCEEEYPSSIDDEEDKFGRSTRRELTDDYQREMRELEMKLNARAMENVGPRPASLVKGDGDVTHDVKQVVVSTRDMREQSNGKFDGSAKKKVSFAQELDISPAPERGTEILPQSKDSKYEVSAVNEAVIERRGHVTDPSSPAPAPSDKPRKASRFKSSRSRPNTTTEHSLIPSSASPTIGQHDFLPERGSALKKASPLHPSAAVHTNSLEDRPNTQQARQTPEGPPGTPLANKIIEHPMILPNGTPPDPDGLDPALLRQQVATEYHRMRNHFIQREGGFKPRDEEQEIVPLTEEEGGSGKKTSRFKAAKLGRVAT